MVTSAFQAKKMHIMFLFTQKELLTNQNRKHKQTEEGIFEQVHAK